MNGVLFPAGSHILLQIALRTGVRETPIWRQMRFSLINVPGGNRNEMIALFSAS